MNPDDRIMVVILITVMGLMIIAGYMVGIQQGIHYTCEKISKGESCIVTNTSIAVNYTIRDVNK